MRVVKDMMMMCTPLTGGGQRGQERGERGEAVEDLAQVENATQRIKWEKHVH